MGLALGDRNFLIFQHINGIAGDITGRNVHSTKQNRGNRRKMDTVAGFRFIEKPCSKIVSILRHRVRCQAILRASADQLRRPHCPGRIVIIRNTAKIFGFCQRIQCPLSCLFRKLLALVQNRPWIRTLTDRCRPQKGVGGFPLRVGQHAVFEISDRIGGSGIA